MEQLDETIMFFNKGVRTGKGDAKQAKSLFGKGIVGEKRRKGAGGGYIRNLVYPEIDFHSYITQEDLSNIDIVGKTWTGNPNVIHTVNAATTGVVSDSDSSDGVDETSGLVNAPC